MKALPRSLKMELETQTGAVGLGRLKFPSGPEVALSPGEKLFLQNKEIITKMTAPLPARASGERSSENCHYQLGSFALGQHHL